MKQPANTGKPLTPRKPLTTAAAKEKRVAAAGDFALTRRNYTLMLAGLGIIILGFILMWGTTEIYEFRKTGLATIVVVAGFIFEIYAIMARPRSEGPTE